MSLIRRKTDREAGAYTVAWVASGSPPAVAFLDYPRGTRPSELFASAGRCPLPFDEGEIMQILRASGWRPGLLPWLPRRDAAKDGDLSSVPWGTIVSRAERA